MRQNGLTTARALFGNLMTGLGHVVRTKSHAALLAQTCGDLVWDRRVLGSTARKETTLLARNVHGFFGQAALAQRGEQGYDIRDDQALPNLQTAINQKSAYRCRTMRLRQACLAGVVA
jgi:hypothetical protein